MAALERIGALLRGAQRWLPEVKHGPQQDSARRFLVARLGIIYGTTRSHIRDDGAKVFDLPTRRHNTYKGEDYGRFRDFVVAVHEALGFDDPERGTDDVIRSVWSNMGKKR